MMNVINKHNTPQLQAYSNLDIKVTWRNYDIVYNEELRFTAWE